MEAIDLISIITIAFLGSFSHCVGMCGGIIIAYSSTKIDNKWSKSKQILAHLLYSFGRVTTYTTLGALFGYLGGVVSFNNIANGTLLIVAGVFMILSGLSLLGQLKFLNRIEHSMHNFSWYRKIFRETLQTKSLYSFYILGLLNGLLPCGLVYFFAVTSASTGSPFWGGVVMFIFGLSTIPALFSLGFFVGIYKNSSLRDFIIKIASIAVIAFGVYTIKNGYEYIKYPQKTVSDCCEFKPPKEKKRDKIENL